MIADQLPRFVFGRMHGTADVVRFEALFQIRGDTNISLLRKRICGSGSVSTALPQVQIPGTKPPRIDPPSLGLIGGTISTISYAGIYVPLNASLARGRP